MRYFLKTAVALLFVFTCALIYSMFRHKGAFATDLKQVTFYPAYGYQENDEWVIPMRLWVCERRELAEAVIARIVASIETDDAKEMANFRMRIKDFVADSERSEAVAFQFDNDPEQKAYQVQDMTGGFPKTEENGIIQGMIRLPKKKAAELLKRQRSKGGRLTFRAVSKGHSGAGSAMLIDDKGFSVISDIDDTIKITEIPAGMKEVIRNTFFRDFRAAPGMARMYREWKDASFHYVSGGPWQLYSPLAEFLFSEKAGFPEGTFHMRDVRKSIADARTWEDLEELVSNENATFEHKVEQISVLMKKFPRRKFILVGDTGEKDPEVYAEIRKRFPKQVHKIIVRDVTDEAKNNKGRLKGTKIIQASQAVKGGSLTD